MSNDIVSKQHFHFSIAPVQGFIAQARRTRDFWAGSFILSWLSAVAMNAVVKQGGEIIFPHMDKDFLQWLLEGQGEKKRPEHGGVPDLFKATVSDNFNPELVVTSVQTAWKALADTVYQEDLLTIGTVETEKIWHDQVKHFWEIRWVILPANNTEDSLPLDVRKNWRSYLPPEQGGVKCMMMDGWQELSGVPRPNTDELTTFWKSLRDKNKQGIKTDLREKEHLCAMGFIKRRFARYFHLINQEMPNGWILKGWTVKVGRPSVAYMAAVHWLEKVLQQVENDTELKKQFKTFHDEAIKLTDGDYDEWDNQIHCLEPFTKYKKWLALDGSLFFVSVLENATLFDEKLQPQRILVLEALKALQRLAGQKIPGLQPPTPFYAVLMMDGDSLGQQMNVSGKQTPISRGLKAFTESVPELVRLHNGFLIYAGGDDVLAVLPLEDALPCALAIRQKYECVFAELNLRVPKKEQVFTSISAAVVFAHINMPLTKLLKTAHALLDEVAKDRYGRDSLAVSVWKQGGRVLEWARPWDKAIENKQLVISRLAQSLVDDDKDGQMSTRFLYKIRERFELLNPTFAPKTHSTKQPPVLSEAQAIDLMAAEYFSSGLCEYVEPTCEKMAHAKTVVTPLLAQCRPMYRKLDHTYQVSYESAGEVLADAAILIRFLAQQSVNV